MANEWTVEESRSVLTEVLRKAAIDVDFRKLCISNAAEAIKKISGKNVPDNFSLTFVEPSDDVRIPLPALQEDGFPMDESLETAFTAKSCNTCCAAGSWQAPMSIATT